MDVRIVKLSCILLSDLEHTILIAYFFNLETYMMKSTKEDKAMLGKTRGLNILPIALFLAFAVYMMPGLAGDALAKEAFAEQAFAEQAFAKEVMAAEGDEDGEGEPEIEWSQDVFYKDFEGNPLRGPVSGAPAPELGENDYNNYEFAPSRIILWVANQQHLYFGSFVLAVPIFCMLIEFVGIRTRESDPAMSAKYDHLAHDLMKVSLTAYSWTAILGGILLFTFITLFPGFFQVHGNDFSSSYARVCAYVPS